MVKKDEVDAAIEPMLEAGAGVVVVFEDDEGLHVVTAVKADAPGEVAALTRLLLDRVNEIDEALDDAPRELN
jgi:hypothetical protein